MYSLKVERIQHNIFQRAFTRHSMVFMLLRCIIVEKRCFLTGRSEEEKNIDHKLYQNWCQVLTL